jgi:hypothetical protein
MNARPLLVLAVAALTSTATLAARPYDPNRDARITESTDSARIAEIERHADALRARAQLNDDQAGTSGTSAARERGAHRRARADRG